MFICYCGTTATIMNLLALFFFSFIHLLDHSRRFCRHFFFSIFDHTYRILHWYFVLLYTSLSNIFWKNSNFSDELEFKSDLYIELGRSSVKWIKCVECSYIYTLCSTEYCYPLWTWTQSTEPNEDTYVHCSCYLETADECKGPDNRKQSILQAKFIIYSWTQFANTTISNSGNDIDKLSMLL